MRTLESFSKTMREVEWFVQFHNKPVWLVPTDTDYKISVVKPNPDELPSGTASNQYFLEGVIVDSVRSSN